MKKEYDDDDGRTIADMSFLDGQYRLFRRKERKPDEEPEQPAEMMSSEERRLYVRGATSAALLIGLIFAGGLALVIFIIDILI